MSQRLKLLIVKFAGTFGSGMLSFAIGLDVLHRTGSALSMGITLIVGPVVAFCILPLVGYVVDTWPRKVVMAAAQAVTIIALLFFAVAIERWPAAYFPTLIGLIVVLEVTDNFLSTSLQASLSQLVAPDALLRVNSLNQTMSSLAEFLAPILGALLYTWLALDRFAYIEVGFEAVALFAIVALRFRGETTKHEAGEAESVVHNFVAGLKYLAAHRLVLVLSAASALLNFFFALINIGPAYLLIHRLGLSNTQYGLTDSAYAVGMMIGGVLLSRWRLKSHPVIFSFRSLIVFAATLGIMGVPALLGLPNSVNTVLFVGLDFLIGVLLVCINTPWDTFVQQIVPEHMQGRVFAVDGMLSTILMPIGTLVFGWLLDGLPIVAVFGVTGAVLLAVVLMELVVITRRGLLNDES
ncbi:MFS transporter [Lacticaseibacillus suibinensis]|uniref:MFS transporter n=1 Tax=Lacticaseibacillus suibinensis TaxID=2486011 RepID=UPI003570E639